MYMEEIKTTVNRRIAEFLKIDIENVNGDTIINSSDYSYNEFVALMELIEKDTGRLVNGHWGRINNVDDIISRLSWGQSTIEHTPHKTSWGDLTLSVINSVLGFV